MSAEWREFHQRVTTWQQAGDAERLRLADLYYEAYRHRETDPERQLEVLTRARDEARRLNEPWWVLLFESNRLGTLTADLHDFARALPLAMDLLVRFHGPEGRAHPQRVYVLTTVLYTYLQVDPVGYGDELERGFAQLDREIGRGPTVNRFVLDYRRTEYLGQTERWEEALDLAHQSLALADQSGDHDVQVWHGAWALFLLCEICHALGRLDEVAGHAADMEGRSAKKEHLLRTRASARLWLAVTQRARGDERAASRSFHRGMHWLKGLDARDEICAEPIARYYETGGQLQAAVAVRDRELAAIAKKGMLHRSCRVRIERCRLLSRAGSLAPADVESVRQATVQLRVPDWYLERLAQALAT
jgi:hypothetical protein